MKSSGPPASIDLREHTGSVRRRRWIVLGGVIIGIVGGLAYAEVAPKTYTAVAAVYILKTGANQSNEVKGARAGGVIDLDSEAQVVTSAAVASAAGNLMGTSLTPSQLAKQVSVTVPPNSGILDIACGAHTPTLATMCANDFAKAYVANRSTAAANTIDSQIHVLKGKIAQLNSTIATLNTQIPTLPSNDLTRISDEATVRSDRVTINAFTRQIATLTGQAADVTGGRIITMATPPGSPTDPTKTLVVPSALILGLILGLLGAFEAERRDKKLRSAEDVKRLLGVPVLLDLSRNMFGRQVSLAAPRSRMGKAFTELANGVAASLGEGSHVLVVAGTSPGPAASVVAANLAATLARTHSEAVLVCADMRDSVATELFGLTDNRGLAEVVSGRATVGEVARGPAGIPGLWVIPPGADTSLAEYHLQYDTAKALTAQLRRDARYVVIEAQAGDDGADTFALSEFADAALLTVEVNRTSREEAGNAITRLHRMRTPIVGAAALPTLGRISVRPPQPVGGQPRLGPDGRDGAVGGHSYGELPGSQDRPVRSRETHGDPADRVPGR